jgi:hypothetical protein
LSRDRLLLAAREASSEANAEQRERGGFGDLAVVHKLLDLLACPVVGRNTGCGCVVRSSSHGEGHRSLEHIRSRRDTQRFRRRDRERAGRVRADPLSWPSPWPGRVGSPTQPATASDGTRSHFDGTQAMSIETFGNETTEERLVPHSMTPPRIDVGLEEYKHLRKAAPTNKVLSRTLKWAERLPPDVVPIALLRHYPRIANVIAATWRHPPFLRSYMDCLFRDDRGNRRGFPPDVLSELVALEQLRTPARPDRRNHLAAASAASVCSLWR